MSEKFFEKDDVTTPSSITRDIYDHEVLLSFNDDFQGYAFADWWTDIGIEAFEQWINENGERYM